MEGKYLIMKFSILVVSFNPGEKLKNTIESIKSQNCTDYEIIIKDGGSTDGSLEKIKDMYVAQVLNLEHKKTTFIEEQSIRVFESKDKGIYDAMNQAVREAVGDYVLYLNCGDTFYDSHVLQKVADYTGKAEKKHKIFYGDIYWESSKTMVTMPSVISDFTCYRNIPCHQACFYLRELFLKHPYQMEYKIRADYEHFLWCFYKGDTHPIHTGIVIASYEGGGFSEERNNLKRDKSEHKEIVNKYMPKMQVMKYQMFMCLSLVGLRKWIAEKSIFAGFYNEIKKLYYQRKK